MDGFFLNLVDFIALAWFGLLWYGYAYFVDYRKGGADTLISEMHKYRLLWVKQMLRREDRLVDVRIIGNLIKSTTFFASTSILIIAGLVAVMGAGDRALSIISKVPFAVSTDIYMWVLKTALLTFIFVYSFFKLTWVLRQFNYATVLMVSAPAYHEGDSVEQIKKSSKYAAKIATMMSNAARHFNMAIRSYYFGFAALSWYINPFLFMVASAVVIWVIYRREFMSKTLEILQSHYTSNHTG